MKHLFIRFVWDTKFKSTKELIDKIEDFLVYFEAVAPALSEFNYFIYDNKLDEAVLSFIPKNNGVVEAEDIIIKHLGPAHMEFCVFDTQSFEKQTVTHVFTTTIDDALKTKETKVIVKSDDSVIKFDPNKHTLH